MPPPSRIEFIEHTSHCTLQFPLNSGNGLAAATPLAAVLIAFFLAASWRCWRRGLLLNIIMLVFIASMLLLGAAIGGSPPR